MPGMRHGPGKAVVRAAKREALVNAARAYAAPATRAERERLAATVLEAAVECAEAEEEAERMTPRYRRLDGKPDGACAAEGCLRGRAEGSVYCAPCGAAPGSGLAPLRVRRRLRAQG